MGTVINQQLAMFLRSIALGACLALVYDLLRVLRRLGGRIWGGILDGAYCVGVSVSLFLFTLAGDGELRLFFLLGAAGGAVLFFCLLSPLLLPLWGLWADILLAPARLAAGAAKKCGRFCKKVFSFWKNRFTIIGKSHRRGRKCPPPEGEAEMANTQDKGRPARKKPRKRASSKLTLLILAVLLIGIAVQLRGVYAQIQSAQAQQDAYQEQLEGLREENAQLAEDIANSEDPALIQEIARDDLGMASEGEKIFRFQ